MDWNLGCFSIVSSIAAEYDLLLPAELIGVLASASVTGAKMPLENLNELLV